MPSPSSSRPALSTRSPQRKARARRVPVAVPSAAPVDRFAARLAQADALARQLVRKGGIDPSTDCGEHFDAAVNALAEDSPDYQTADAARDRAGDTLKHCDPLPAVRDLAFQAYTGAALTREIALIEAAYLLGLAVGRRLAPGVPL